MTRINTNVSSLIAQKTLARTNADLQTALTRLSTGLRINTGKDDPAGLIASENLRRDITSIQKAITNSERANQLIATADSALGQVSQLLNDIRGLVTEAANSGALSDEQIAANQLQIDSSLEALNRISQTTTFQGRKILDGSLDFNKTAGSNYTKLSDVRIDQANLGATGQMAVDVQVTAAATKAQIDITNIPVAVAASAFEAQITIADAAQQASVDMSTSGLDDAGNIVGSITAKSTGAFAGADGNGVQIVFAEDNGTASHTSSLTGTTLTITVGTQGAGPTIALQTILDAVAGENGGNNDFNNNFSHNVSAGNYTVGTDASESVALAGGKDVGQEVITITGNQVGASLNTTFTLAEGATTGGVLVEVTGNLANGIAIKVNTGETASLAQIKTALDDFFTANNLDFTVATSTSGDTDGNFIAGTDTATVSETNGVNASGGLAKKVVFQLTGATGSEVFQFQAGTSIDNIIAAVNLVKDATGVEASKTGTTLELKSTAYGSDAYVDVNVIEEATGGTFEAAIGKGARQIGTDVVATVNGVEALGNGNTLSINTVSLDVTMSVEAGFTGSAAFTITGGGALFQLGPDVVSNQQARVGIGSVNAARLGGANGKLFELASGGAAALKTDASKAARIVDEAINQVTSLRGRLGAFQKTTLETNIFTLNDTLANLTDAESSIRDADFAAESARLTRAQILVQSGTSVLSIANSNPQNVLALLR